MAYQNIERRDLLRAIKGRPVREEMEMIMDVAGQDAVWRHNPTDKDGPWNGRDTFGTAPMEKLIVIKTSRSAIDKLIRRYKGSYITQSKGKGGQKWYKEGDFIRLFVGTQVIKFQQTGKLTTASGKSISEATMTRMQELGSAFVFKRAIQDNKSWGNMLALRADTETMNGVKKIWKDIGDVDDVDEEWLNNFYKQQKTLIAKIGRPNFTVFNREGGFMEFISNLVKTEYGISSKDNWNPADIWLIQDESKWTKLIEDAVKSGRRGRSPAKTVLELNAIMRMLFRARQVFGISLKKVAAGQDARIQFVNDKSEFFQKLDQLHFEFDGADCKLGQKKDKEGTITLSTQDTRLYIKDGSNIYNFQIKANNSTSMSNLKYEPTSSGSTAARLGKATVELVEALLKDYNLKFKKDNTAYPQNAKEFLDNKGGNWKELIEILHRNKVDIDVDDVQTAYDNLLFVFGTKPFVANAKCQQIKWLTEYLSLSSEDRDTFGTDMVFIAKKEGKKYGVFAKIF